VKSRFQSLLSNGSTCPPATARLTAERVEPRALFDQFDGDRDGRLDAGEVKAMVQRLIPGLKADEMRWGCYTGCIQLTHP
jgi:hypothetical protein